MTNAMTTVLKITGMTCGNCARHVREALAAVPGVTAVAVDLAAGQATITHGTVDAAALRAAIIDAGYTVAASA